MNLDSNYRNVLLDRPASSASDTKLSTTLHRHQRRQSNNLKSPSTTSCCACFPTSSQIAAARNSVQLSEVYCMTCSDTQIDSPSCLTTFSKQKSSEHSTTLLDVESEIQYSKNFNKKLVMTKPPVRISSGKNVVEYEIACEAECDDGKKSEIRHDDDDNVKFAVMTEKEKREMVRVESKEETPSRLNVKQNPSTSSSSSIHGKKEYKSRLDFLRGNNKKLNKFSNTVNNNETTSFIEKAGASSSMRTMSNDSDDNNNSNDDNETTDDSKNEGEKNVERLQLIKHLSLPMVNKHKHKKTISIPQRITADGTKIFYLCDLPKKLRKGSHYIFSYYSSHIYNFILFSKK